MVKQLEESPNVKKLVHEIAEGIAANKISPFDAMQHFCKLCQVLRSGDLICNWHKSCLDVPEYCNVCPPAAKKH